MRVLFFSDCHIELRAASTRTSWCDIYPLDLGPCLTPYAGKVDLAILAGDIGTFRPRDGVTVYQYLEQAAQYLQCPIVFVPGNHEYYNGFFEDDLTKALAKHIPAVTILDRGEAFFNTRRRPRAQGPRHHALDRLPRQRRRSPSEGRRNESHQRR
jgi:hypothetical protein